ncbi:DUF748 domain-containing protein [Aquincola tertiaricarbonis]|uniref:DUF748 domain-containing protein n=1 Tax=Aquincola tertiaricarbonis TaxID=391953 RepID=UPI0006973046|nr:DUF748 domain-containing protein [Aquincola tertiaricarbonis]
MHAQEEHAGPEKTPAARRWLRRAGWALATLLGLWLLTWLALPPLLQAQAQQRLSSLLGRPVQVGAVSLAPWVLSVTVQDLRIGPAGGAAGPDTLHIGRLHADVSASSLWRRAPVVEALQIDRPVVQLTRLPGGALDIDDIVARLQPQPGEAPTPPARFALYNLELTGGRVTVDDRQAGLRHELVDLRLDLPFLSNLPADVAVRVQPRLAFRMDGSSFDTGAALVPFAEVRSGQLALRIDDLDVARWAAYLPAASSPLRPTAGRLSTEITADFSLREGHQPHLALRGQARLSDVVLAAGNETGGKPLAAWQRLEVELQDVLPLERRVALGEVLLQGLQLTATRDAGGRLELARMVAPPPEVAKPPATPPWQLRLQRLRLQDAAVQWRDDTTRPAAALALSALQLEAGPLDTTALAGVPWRLASRLAASGGSRAATLEAEGTAGAQAAQASIGLQALDLTLLGPYLEPHLAVPMAGAVALTGRLHWSAGAQPRLAAELQQLRVADLRLGEGPAAAGWRNLTVADGQLDLLARTLAIGRLELEEPRLALQRAADGTLDASQWLRRAPAAAQQDSSPAAAPWQLQLGQLQLRGGRLRWADQAPATPVALQLADLRLDASGLRWPAQAAAPARISLQARLSDARTGEAGKPTSAPGRIDWTGTLAPQPLMARGALRVRRLPLHALAPYASTGLQLVLAHADADWQGQVALQQQAHGLSIEADGDARLGDVQVQAPPRDGVPGDALLAWQDLQLQRLQVRLAPGAAPQVSVQEAALSDFYSRLVITEEGRFNLRDVAAAPGGVAEPAGAAGAVTPGPVIAVGSTRLLRGSIDFTDRFIRPNYSAELSGLNGSLGTFSTASPQMAALSLQGRVAGTALLDISGSLNPAARPLAMDIRAKATDLELSPLSPYSGRYAGYAIERGKLSMDVAYRIAPDGRLDASNRVVLNQLTFGERVDSPDATQLPVALAIALLKDRHGVIDLDLPVSGSVNDPQFSVFGLVLKVLGNLLVKAVTAPFSLFAGGGEADASRIGFVPGTDRMAAGAEAALDTVARALADRPGLQLTVSGSGDLALEQDALRAAGLDARLLSEHRRRAGPAAPPPTPEEQAALLRRLYADTPLPDKPRNLVGLAKSLPPQEMAERLQAVLPAGEEQLRELAQRRGTAVRDALLARGVPSERLFLAAPRLGGGGGARPGAPEAELVLSAR